MMLDVFKEDAFGLVSLTHALEKLPYIPKMLGEMGLFSEKGITTTTVVMEEKHGKLSLIQTQARGTMPQVQLTETRKTRAFPVSWLPENDTIMADEVQGVRKFGSEDAVQGVAEVVNNKLARLKQNMEATLEWHRLGAVLGKTYDADGTSLLFDWYDEFDITQFELDFDFTNATLNVLDLADAAQQLVEDTLGADTYDEITAICGNQFFRSLISHPSVKDAFKAWQVGSGFGKEVFTTGDTRKKRRGFEFGGITWRPYRGHVGSTPFFPTDECRFLPSGVPELFQTVYAPAPFIETVNTTGKKMYAKQDRMKFDVGVELHVCSCPLMYVTRPAVVVKGNMVAALAGLYEFPEGPLE